MHPLRDESILSPPKSGFSYSRRKPESDEVPNRLDRGDFLNPEDLESVRRTGYGKGHVRTMLGYDSFGPKHSASLTKRRLAGQLPQAQNVDLNFSASVKYLNPEERELAIVQKKQTMRLTSSLSSLPTTGSGSVAMNPFRNLVQDAAFDAKADVGVEGAVGRNLKSNQFEISAWSRGGSPEPVPVIQGPGSTLLHTVAPLEDKSVADPRTKSLLWHQHHTKSLE
eukprot:gene1589-1844_t